MSILSTAVGISAQVNPHLPATLAAVMAVEAAGHQLPNDTKLQTVVNVVLAGSQLAEGVPIPEVQEIAQLAKVVVSILNAFGIFNHGKKPPNIPVVPLVAAAPVAP